MKVISNDTFLFLVQSNCLMFVVCGYACHVSCVDLGSPCPFDESKQRPVGIDPQKGIGTAYEGILALFLISMPLGIFYLHLQVMSKFRKLVAVFERAGFACMLLCVTSNSSSMTS